MDRQYHSELYMVDLITSMYNYTVISKILLIPVQYTCMCTDREERHYGHPEHDIMPSKQNMQAMNICYEG
jgi:hypothetical protein